MNAPTSSQTQPRRRYGRWILAGLVLLMTPVAVIAIGVLSMLSLNRDAAVLRREVMAATDSDWHTKVQLSAGWLTLGAVRTGLRFIEHEHMDDARDAMAAVRKVSVGVYERVGRAEKWSREQLLTNTDTRMRQRGWTRLVGVTEEGQAVLVYGSDAADSGDRLDVCVAVVDGRDLVIVSAKVDAENLLRLAERHLPEGGFRQKMKHVKI
ncbi:MAG TPA: hypothetical protein VG734_19295 [Lacunisphaera sp.]|nr:hypothetical protein [Lacunisphaera sp.]